MIVIYIKYIGILGIVLTVRKHSNQPPEIFRLCAISNEMV